MLSRAFAIAALFSCAIALGQSTNAQRSDDPNPTPRQKCFISGRVSRSTDGAPLKKAVVTLLSQQNQAPNFRPVSAMTDNDGIFLLKDIEAGRYTLMVARTGYVRQMYGQRTPTSPGTTLNLLEGQTLKDINVRLIPGGAISGRVVDEDSEPISGVRLQAMRWGYRNGKRELVPSGGFAQTDDRGEYRMFQLAPGRYYLSATYSGQGYVGGGVMMASGNGVDPANEGYAPTYYPGVNDPAQATALELRGGEDLPGINLRLTPVRAVRVKGRVVHPGGAHGVAWVRLQSRHGTFAAFPRNATVDDRGEFELHGVTAGEYFLVAEGEENGKRLQARRAVEVDSSDVDGIVLTLQPQMPLRGQVTLDGTFDPKPDHMRVMLSSQEPGPFGNAGGAVDANLSFTITDLFDGEYNLRLFGIPQDAYVSAASMGRRDVLRDGVSISGKSDVLNVVVSASGGRLDGTVQDEDNNPFRGARVVLVPEESKRQDLFKVTSSDQYGQFSMRGIAPGKYKLFAWETVDEGAFYDPDFLRPILDSGKAVEVSPSSRAQVQVRVIRSEASGS